MSQAGGFWNWKIILIGAQMLFVAFGAMVLMPLLTGLDPSVALFTAGLGTSGLAFYLSQKYAPQRTQELKLFYEDELARALSEDGSSTSVHILPKTYYPGT